MRLPLEVHRARRLSLTPLVDVIFLLLLFFMLSSTFTRYGQVELTGTASGGNAIERPDILVTVGADRLRINGAFISMEDAPARLTALETAGAETALVVVEADATSEDLIGLVEAARRQTSLAVTVAR